MLARRGFGRVGRPGLLGTMARTAVVAGTATAVAGGVQRHQQSRQEDGQQADQQADQTAQLQQLAEMRSQGLLDEAEFAAAKAKLLGL